MGVQENIAAFYQALEAWSAPERRDEYFHLYDSDAVIRLHGVSSVNGLRPLYAALWTAFPDARITIEDVVAEGNKLAYRIGVHGTHKGPFEGLPPTGKPISVSQIGILEFKDGKVVSRWAHDDLPQALAQLKG